MAMAVIKALSTKDDFHRERSRFIDAFAGLEEVLQHVPKTGMAKQLVDEIKALRSIRNDLVHSQLRFVQIDGQLQAIALNVQETMAVARQARLVKFEDFSALASQIESAKRKVSTAA